MAILGVMVMKDEKMPDVGVSESEEDDEDDEGGR